MTLLTLGDVELMHGDVEVIRPLINTAYINRLCITLELQSSICIFVYLCVEYTMITDANKFRYEHEQVRAFFFSFLKIVISCRVYGMGGGTVYNG